MDTGPDAQFRSWLDQGRFMLQRSEGGGFVFYPRVAEPGTGEPLEWVEASGRGTVYATTVVRRKPPEPSYNVVIVELAEGPRMMSSVVGAAPGDVAIGLAVRARIDIVDGAPAVFFEPER